MIDLEAARASLITIEGKISKAYRIEELKEKETELQNLLLESQIRSSSNSSSIECLSDYIIPFPWGQGGDTLIHTNAIIQELLNTYEKRSILTLTEDDLDGGTEKGSFLSDLIFDIS